MTKFSTRDKVDFTVAWGGATLVMTMLLTAGIMAHVHGPNDTNNSTLEPENCTTEAYSSTPWLTTELPPAVDYRLPTSLKPIHYVVKLQPFISGNFSIQGYVEVELEVVKPTHNITLHMADIITHNDTVQVRVGEVESGENVQVVEHEWDPVREWYVAHLERQLQVNQHVVISMAFTGYLNDMLRGFYRSSYTNADGDTVMLAVSFFAATDARRAFPCMDEPALKATFSISLARELHMTALSNMPRYDTQPIVEQPGWVWDHFNDTVPMSTYLVAFVISDFVKNATDYRDAEFAVWSRRTVLEQTELALNTGTRVLEFFEDYFSILYPLPKQDMVAIPDFAAGAMENWGLITYSELKMLYVGGTSPASNKQRTWQVMVHELAHMWFGNLVTPVWWNDIWLNEGFASYMEYVGTHHLEPEWKMLEQFVSSEMQCVFLVDSLESSHPLSVPVNTPEDISQIYDTIAYVKGSAIIRMMNYFLTENTFKTGLTNYLNYFAYDVATQDDLWHFLTEAAHEDGTLASNLTVKTIMDTWTLQMGYPVITVNRSANGTSASVRQHRFLLVQNSDSRQQQEYMWWVPLSYTSGDNPDFSKIQPSVWMKDTEQEVNLTSLPDNNTWVIFNLQETGYYRVNYDHNNWEMLMVQLARDHQVISVINRAQIIDDALNLARAGELAYDTALRVTTYLANETEYLPWDSALTSLSYLKQMFIRFPGYASLKKYLLDLLTPLYESVGFEDNLNDPHLDQLKRVLALSWTCKLGHQDCVDNAVQQFNRWLYNGSTVSPNLKSTVYCAGIEAGGQEEWDAVWSNYLASNVATEKNQLLLALGCSREEWILTRYLDMAFTVGSGIRKQDSTLVFEAVASSNYGHELAWTFLRDQLDRIANYYDTFSSLGSLITSATREFNTETEKHLLKVFYDEGEEKTLGSVSWSVQQALENTDNNIAWMNRNYDHVLTWLHNNGYTKMQ